ncbi:phospholipase A and acyltransferase 3-like [Thunnus albacares]|uniref:phospholipase A and acyltransferase 3-like n=1 Tax=Thunnus albacares TaxID=8236 RepID=UPI001CF64983|nr:phospholipase A and acyltransferase 3-like [Thunnus albacares]
MASSNFILFSPFPQDHSPPFPACFPHTAAVKMGAKDLEPGDLIEIFRGIYQHWAVYIGDLYVVHFVAGINSPGALPVVLGGFVDGEVRKDKLQDVINKDKWKKNNTSHTTYDKKLKSRSKAEIVKEALSMVGKAVKYSVSDSNCEHFATMCRYGKALSLQVQQAAAATVGSGILGAFSVMSFST